MLAAVVTGKGHQLGLEVRADPRPCAGQVVVEVGRCGICGSDLHMVDDARYGRRPGDVMGHEYAGRVVAIGADVERVRKGDHVAIVPFRSCGSCDACRRGEPAWCATMALEGGGYAEYALTRERQCVVLPRSIGIAEGALVEPVAVALHGLNIAGSVAGKRVLVIGAGPIGVAVCWWALRRGAAQVTARDLSAQRCERALALGATSIELAGDGTPRIPDRYDIVFDCSGARGILAHAIEEIKPRGTIVLLGLCTALDSFVPFTAIRKEARILSAVFFSQIEFEQALDALMRTDALAKILITDTVSMLDLPLKFDALRRGEGNDCKVLIAPGRLAA